ncbi:MAG: DUF2254 domain-containing protein [Gammaproteobacteria bacterium]|nr:DUF2254 domain-containing protein [Gammaproteobacteria bacterium]
MGAETGGDAFEGASATRALGRTLRRHRRLRVNLTQLAYVVGGIALGLALPRIPVGFTVPRAETTQMLFAVGAGLLGFLAIAFSLAFLVVQFGSTTYTPRLNLFYTSPRIWHGFGFITGVLVFAFAAAYSETFVPASGGESGERMSGLVPIVMIALLMGAIVVYRSLQMRAFGSVELSSILAEVTERGRQVLDGVYADEPPRDSGGARQGDGHGRHLRALPEGRREVAWPGRSGIIQDVDVPRIVDAARNADAAVEIVVPTGEMVHHGATVAVIHGHVDPSLDEAVVRAIRAGAGRTFEQDPTMAFRVLVDIALRALSPAINDPTTAVQVLDSEEDLLRMLVGRDLDAGEITGPHGRTRVLLALPGWDDYVALAVDEIVEAGAAQLRIRGRVERLLNDLTALAPEHRRVPLRMRLDDLHARWPAPHADAGPLIPGRS